jgi:DnaK suppressor protein
MRDLHLEFCMRRSHVVSTPSSVLTERRSDPIASRLPALRAALEQQRDFRRDQLAELGAHGRARQASSPVDDSTEQGRDAVSALGEVDALVAVGARRALADIELALARMGTGRYGCCRTCGADIPLLVLEAIPKSTLCLACLWGSRTLL